jgi:hypothetical protein
MKTPTITREITEQHELAEKIGKILNLGSKNGRVTHNGRVVSETALPKLYIDAQMAHQGKIPVMSPITLFQLLTDLAEVNRELELDAMKNSGLFHMSPIEYVQASFAEKRVEISVDGIWSRIFEGKRTDYNQPTFLADLKANLIPYNYSIPEKSGYPHITSESIAPALSVILADRSSKQIADLQKELQYQETGINSRKFVEGLLKIYWIEPSDVNISMFLHLIWSIKRKLWLKENPNPVFISLFSRMQGVGKTSFLKKLCTGFEWIYSANGHLSKMLNSNDFKAMIRGRYLIDFQELAKDISRNNKSISEDAVMATFKGLITTGTVGGRDMYLPIDGVERQTATFVSSTNIHIWDIFRDPSGMRRYWEFEMKPPKKFDSEFYLEANVYFDNIKELYRSVNELDDIGYFHPSLCTWRSMRDVQESYAKDSAFTLFAKAQNWEFVPEGTEGAETIKTRTVLDKFNRYLNDRGDTEWTAKFLQSMISYNLGVHSFTEIVNGQPKEFYCIRSIK